MTAVVALSGLAQGQVRDSVVRYPSGSKQVTLECFVPSASGRHPTVLLLHGSGGLEQATGAVFREIARALAIRGYVALIPHYFEKTDHVIGRPLQAGEYEGFLDSLKDAMEYAATQQEVDPARFAIIGYSMGSNLAMLRAVKDSRIKAIVSCSGSYPPTKPSKKLPPLLILHGSKDKSTPIDYVKKYQEGLKEQEMPHAVHIYPGKGHNLDVPTFENVTVRAVAFFDKYVKPSERAR
jgi:dienelactone hydrolase